MGYPYQDNLGQVAADLLYSTLIVKTLSLNGEVEYC